LVTTSLDLQAYGGQLTPQILAAVDRQLADIDSAAVYPEVIAKPNWAAEEPSERRGFGSRKPSKGAKVKKKGFGGS
jgi:hypothetical protein